MRYFLGAQTPALAAGKNEFEEVKESTPFFSPGTAKKSGSRFAHILHGVDNVYLFSSLFLAKKRTRLYLFRYIPPPYLSANWRHATQTSMDTRTIFAGGPSKVTHLFRLSKVRNIPMQHACADRQITHYAIIDIMPPLRQTLNLHCCLLVCRA
jgi:hypothetical protein